MDQNESGCFGSCTADVSRPPACHIGVISFMHKCRAHAHSDVTWVSNLCWLQTVFCWLISIILNQLKCDFHALTFLLLYRYSGMHGTVKFCSLMNGIKIEDVFDFSLKCFSLVLKIFLIISPCHLSLNSSSFLLLPRVIVAKRFAICVTTLISLSPASLTTIGSTLTLDGLQQCFFWLLDWLSAMHDQVWTWHPLCHLKNVPVGGTVAVAGTVSKLLLS